MTEKDSYNAYELAEALGIKVWKVFEMLKRGEVRHTHLNQSHHNVRIPKDEFMRLVEAKSPEKLATSRRIS